jgi:hypothetical protein
VGPAGPIAIMTFDERAPSLLSYCSMSIHQRDPADRDPLRPDLPSQSTWRSAHIISIGKWSAVCKWDVKVAPDCSDARTTQRRGRAVTISEGARSSVRGIHNRRTRAPSFRRPHHIGCSGRVTSSSLWDLPLRWSRGAVSAVIRKFGLAQNGQKSLLAPIIERRGIAALGSKRATTSAAGESKR